MEGPPARFWRWLGGSLVQSALSYIHGVSRSKPGRTTGGNASCEFWRGAARGDSAAVAVVRTFRPGGSGCVLFLRRMGRDPRAGAPGLSAEHSNRVENSCAHGHSLSRSLVLSFSLSCADITGMGEEIRVGRRCFVSNLAWRTSWQDLKDKFRDCGTVVYANVMRDESNRSKGWGIVEFETAEEAVNAMNTLNGAEIHGRPIIVREDREDREIKDFSKPFGGKAFSAGMKKEGEDVPNGTQVVVHGLPWSYTGDQLLDIFRGVGDIVKGDVAYGRDGRSRGYGVIQFASAEQANHAINQFNGTELEGRVLSVKLDGFA